MGKTIITGALLLSCLMIIQTTLANVILGTVTNNTGKNIVFTTAAGNFLKAIKAGKTKNFNISIPIVYNAALPDNIQFQRRYLAIRVPTHPEIEPLTFYFIRSATLNPQLGTTTLTNTASLQRGSQALEMWHGPAQPHNTLLQGQEDDYRIDVVLEGDNLQNSQLEVTTSIVG